MHRAQNVQTMIYRMEEKGAVRRVKKVGNAHIIEAAVTRRSVHGNLIGELLNLFGGSAAPLVSHLVQTGKLTLADIKELEKQPRNWRRSHDALRAAARSRIHLLLRAALCRGALVYERGGGTACHRSGRSLEVRDPVAPVSADRCSAGILLAGCAMALFGGQQSLGYLIGTGRHLSGKHESAHGARLLAGIWAPGKRRNGHAVVYASAARLRCSPPSKPAEENALTEVLSLMPVRVPPDIAISDAANGPALQERYGSRGFQAIDVAIDPNADLLIENFAKDYQTKFPVGWASIDQMMNYMGFQGRPVVPQLVLIDRAGNIRYATPRLGDPDAMKQEFISSRIEELLAARR